jgi:hypothetical protein
VSDKEREMPTFGAILSQKRAKMAAVWQHSENETQHLIAAEQTLS